MTEPSPRTIPPGKIMLAEYGELNDTNRAIVSLLASAYSARIRGDVQLVRSSPGFETAGSCARWTNGFYAVWFYVGGSRNGRQYRLDDETSARAHFARLTETEAIS